VTRDIEQAARTILAGTPGDTAQQLAERAANACEQLVKHLARLLGETGVHLMLKRSIVRASAKFPWLAAGISTANSTSALRSTLEPHDLDSITEAFVAILSGLIELLERLIGEGLVERLLEEVWPGVFSHEAKDTP
jgi:hypothetical protein